MKGYLNTEREVEVLEEAENEAKALRLTPQLKRLKKLLKIRLIPKGFKKIEPKTANTYEARLNRQYRAFIVFDEDKAIIFRVGDHL